MSVKLISITPNAEAHIAYCARISNPNNQNNKEFSKLLKYLIEHKHWSPFEMAHLTLEIKTSRAIAAQILRHRSFSFQEFSQRYSEISEYVNYPARRQDTKNRQNSIDDLSQETKDWFNESLRDIWDVSYDLYQEALKKGIAKECARMLLPLCTASTLYMSGSIRSWVHYIQLRTDISTQLEHRLIAEECKKIFVDNLPNLGEALSWNKELIKT